MGFNEWNLNMALYYGGFNFKTSFQLQYSTLDPIIFGYNNILVIFFRVKSTLFSIQLRIHSLQFLTYCQVYFDYLFYPLLIL
jgi:hypothetical protein